MAPLCPTGQPSVSCNNCRWLSDSRGTKKKRKGRKIQIGVGCLIGNSVIDICDGEEIEKCEEGPREEVEMTLINFHFNRF